MVIDGNIQNALQCGSAGLHYPVSFTNITMTHTQGENLTYNSPIFFSTPKDNQLHLRPLSGLGMITIIQTPLVNF